MSDELTNVKISIEILCLTDDAELLREAIDDLAGDFYDILFETTSCIDPVMSVTPPVPFEFDEEDLVV